ncbi:ribosomal biogenesis protein LAS1L-like [Liolophura sinensis]|uniref:ribosomal biogenesis protein LAS1L-like n=1 Tax=Liolophura sinensis TaxID=3198878 RepID=UPI00315838D7
MSKSSDRVLPWLNRAEFLKGYHCLYSDDEASQRDGINRVALWRCRAHHKLPIAIDCTSVLIASTLQDAEFRRRGELHSSEHHVKLSYAIALIRLVNHITEKGQKKQYAQSIHILAAEFGLPEWLVDMRHDTTHGELPSLDLLREGVEWALDWLHQEYWQKQLAMDENPGSEDKETNSDLVKSLLVDFMQIQFNCLSNNASVQGDSSIRQILSKMEYVFPKIKDLVISCMVSEGYLIVTPDQLNALRFPESSLELLNSVDDLHLPNDIILFWKPVLEILYQLQVTPLLLDMLCEQLTEEENLANRFRAGWIYEIVNYVKMCKRIKKMPERALFTRAGSVSFAPLAEKCLGKPSVYTPTLVQNFLECSSGELGKPTSEILSLVKIYAGKSEGELKEPSLGLTCFSVKDLPPVTLQDKRSSHHLLDGVPWKLCNDSLNWQSSPIGLLPHQKLENFSLELKEHILSDVQDICSTDVQTEHISMCSSHGVFVDGKELPQPISGPAPSVQLL